MRARVYGFRAARMHPEERYKASTVAKYGAPNKPTSTSKPGTHSESTGQEMSPRH